MSCPSSPGFSSATDRCAYRPPFADVFFDEPDAGAFFFTHVMQCKLACFAFRLLSIALIPPNFSSRHTSISCTNDCKRT
jgi:hypothetical protein